MGRGGTAAPHAQDFARTLSGKPARARLAAWRVSLGMHGKPI